MTDAKWQGTAYAHPDDVPAEKWDLLMMSRDEYEAMVTERSIRDQAAPNVGDVAPDFTARRLDSRDATPFRLSETRGRPVGLIFGSYT